MNPKECAERFVFHFPAGSKYESSNTPITKVGERYTRSKKVDVLKNSKTPAQSLPNHVSRHFQKEIL